MLLELYGFGGACFRHHLPDAFGELHALEVGVEALEFFAVLKLVYIGAFNMLVIVAYALSIVLPLLIPPGICFLDLLNLFRFCTLEGLLFNRRILLYHFSPLPP